MDAVPETLRAATNNLLENIVILMLKNNYILYIEIENCHKLAQAPPKNKPGRTELGKNT